MRLSVIFLFCLSLTYCSKKNTVYTKYWHARYVPFNRECRDSVYIKFGIKYDYQGCISPLKHIRHNERVDKKLAKKYGESWQELINTELAKCPNVLDSGFWDKKPNGSDDTD